MRALLALLLLVSCGAEADTGPWGASPWAGPPMRVPAQTSSLTGSTTTLYNRDFRLNASADSTPTIPVCSVATSCVMQCTVTSTTWSCVDASGASIAVTQGAGEVAFTDPLGYSALDEVNDTRAPQLTSAFDSVLAGAHTILTTGYLTTHGADGTTATMTHVLANTSGSSLILRNEGSSWKALAGTYVANTGSGTGPIGGLAMFAETGNTALTTFKVYDMASTATSGAGAFTAPVGTIWRFGRSSGAGASMRGPLEMVTVYNVEKTPTEITALQFAWAGMAVDAANPITLARTTAAWRVVGGRAVPYGYGVPIVSTRGIEFDPALAGNAPQGAGWATDATDASSWTAIGTPTTTVNVAAGPFAAWKVGIDATGEADLIVDDDAANFEGYKGTLGCGDSQTVVGDYTASCWVRSGTSGTTRDKVTIGVLTDGTGSTTCTTTGLTSTFQRVQCYADVEGSPTSIKGEILVGGAAADTGSIIVSQCQCENRAWASAEKPDSTAIADDVFSITGTETTTWPSGQSSTGDMEVIFTPDFNHPSQSADYLMVTDGQNAANLDHWIFIAFQYVTKTTPLKMRVALRPDASVPQIGDNTDTDTYSDIIPDIVAGTQYVARFRYVPAGSSGGYARVDHYLYFDTCPDASTCHATTLVGSDTTHTKLASTDIDRGPVFLGRRYNNLREYDGAIARLTVKEIR